MNDDRYCGKWAGEYTYGDDYIESLRGKCVAFEIDITLVNGLIQGHCTDAEATPHFEQPALIEGSILGQTISFVKRYPYYWQHEEKGQRFLPKLPSQEILYSGQFTNEQFEGEWEITSTLPDVQGGFIAYKGSGRWFMKKL